MKTIRVTGKGQLVLRPDTTVITITLGNVCPEYSDTLREASEHTEQLRSILSGFGFCREDLKTMRFHVSVEEEGVHENGVFRTRFVGYRYEHALKVEFPSDNERLGRILYALADSPIHPQLQLSYTVKDPEAAKNALLGKAVADAREKAAVMAAAAEVSLKGIQSIDYAWGALSFEVPGATLENRVMGALRRSKQASLDMNIEPDDLYLSDTVTVVWELG